MGIQIHAETGSYFSGTVALWVRDVRSDGSRARATSITFQDVEPGFIQEPLMMLEEADAVSFMDSLWRAGIRPSEASNPSETVSAHKDHIASLKSVTDRLFGIIE
jgi:hypothetical protein